MTGDWAGPSDGELVRAARAGDLRALGPVLEGHRAGMRAVAVALLGYGPAAEDAVQDAMVTALSAVDSLREADAVGAWLRAIVRNNCRMQLRGRHPWIQLEADLVGTATLEDLLDRHATRDWVWSAIGRLTEPLQVVLLLRHFGPRHTYADIATICGIPIGTVRSRLSEARRLLIDALRTEATAAYADSGALVEERREGLVALLHGAELARPLSRPIAELTLPDMVMAGWWGQVPHARWLFDHILRSDAEAGVREHVAEVLASTAVTVMECDLVSPPWDPTHCPPSVLWVIQMHDERIRSIRLHHPVPA